MAAYYFTVSSLPELQLFAPPPITMEEFFSRCSMEVREKDLKLLTGILEGETDPGSEVLARWSSCMKDLDHELAYLRSEKLNRPHERVRHAGRDIREAARHLVNLSSPLEAEKEYLKFEWDLAEELESGHLFDRSKLILYVIKLRILLRYALFEQQEGKDQFQEVFTHVRSRIEEL